MPQYEFGMPDRIQEILDALERSKNQPQQERPTAADLVTDATMQGANNDKAAFTQQQQAAQQQQALQQQPPPQPQQIPQQPQPPLQQRPLTQLDLLLANELIGSKEAYEGADGLAKAKAPQGADEAAIKTIADEIRNSAHGDAENTRRLASAVGVDLSPYGEGVTLDDARFNLKSRQVKEIADIMSGQGQYGRTADQYFQDEYRHLTMQGYSVREAKALAGELAQSYQADRLGYLRNAYNVHGRDGNYTNDIGVGILDAIAQENPAVAQVYATAYKIPKEAQNRYEQLEDTNLEQMFKERDALANYGYNSALQRENYGYNAKLKEQGHRYTLEEDTNRYIQAGKNALDAIRLTAALRKKDPSKVEELFGNFYQLGQLAGLQGDDLDAFARENTIRAAANYYLNGGKGGSGKGNSDEPKYTEKQNTFLNKAENLFSMAKEDISNEDKINQFEALIKGTADATGLEDDKAVTMLDFPVGVRQELEDWLNVLRGGYYKAHADDDKAAAYWLKVRDKNLLKHTFPHENFDKYTTDKPNKS